MEVKVWVDEIPRVVSGATYNTTCQDVVFALAQALNRTGRFSLIEKWRNSSRPLNPDEFPLRVLQKWGEYAPEVRFILCQACTEDGKPPLKDKLVTNNGEQLAHISSQTHGMTGGAARVKRSLTFTGACGLLPQTSVSPSSALTSKFRKTKMGPVPNGDVHHLMGSTKGSHRSPQAVPNEQLGFTQVTYQPPHSVPKQQRRAREDQELAHQSGTSQNPSHPVPPPRHHHFLTPHTKPSSVHNSVSPSQPSRSPLPDLTLNSIKTIVPSHQPVPAVRSQSVTLVSPTVNSKALSESFLSSQSKPQVSSRAGSQFQTKTAAKSTQRSQDSDMHSHDTSSAQASQKPPQRNQERVLELQAQHATHSITQPSPLSLSPPLSVVVSSPAPEHDQGLEKIPDIVEDTSVVSPDQDPFDNSEHSSQTSLEIEEYDLEHNFPDTQRELSNPERPSVSMEYCLDDGMGSASVSRLGSEGDHDGEHSRLRELVNNLQEQLKAQESQIEIINTEITILEEKEKEYEEKLHVIMEDLLLYENRHKDLEVQLNELGKVEWDNVLDGEKKCEVDLTLKIAAMKASILQHEEKLADVRTKETRLLSELKEEEEKLCEEQERLKAEEARAREEEANMKEEISKLQASLTEEQQKTTEYEALMSNVDSELKSVGQDLVEKQKAITETEAKLKDENLKDFSIPPVLKEGSTSTESGETVLKILEGRLSPRLPANAYSKTGEGPHSPSFMAVLTSSDPSGVWV